MDASDIIRRNEQVANAAAKVSQVKLKNTLFVANTVSNITYVSTMTFSNSQEKINFDTGMQFITYTSGIPTVSTMVFCASRT
jgi:hypothetical protein